MYFCVNEYEVGFNDSIFSGNEQQKMYYILVVLKRLYNKPFIKIKFIKSEINVVQYGYILAK